MSATQDTGVMPVNDLAEWFREAVDSGAGTLRIDATEHTRHYLVNLLTRFARSEPLFRDSRGQRGHRPLALMLKDALEAEERERRYLGLQRLGDVALFLAGALPEGLPRRGVDVDYFVSLGGGAYVTLGDLPPRGPRERALNSVFRELGGRFIRFVDLLNEVVDAGRATREPDLLRLHRIWQLTGSERAARSLSAAGVVLSGDDRGH